MSDKENDLRVLIRYIALVEERRTLDQLMPLLGLLPKLIENACFDEKLKTE